MICYISTAKAQNTWNSDLVEINQNGRLTYYEDSLGNQIADFSYAGFNNSMEPIPNIEAVMVLDPVEGDNTAHIQNAINTWENTTTRTQNSKTCIKWSPGPPLGALGDPFPFPKSLKFRPRCFIDVLWIWESNPF